MASEPATLLVVDDNEDNRDLMCRRLERDGFRVEAAENGRQALARVAQGGISLVLLDVMMPDMSGLQVLTALRKEHSGARLPVIMVTARSQSADMVEALSMGANDYVTKPVDFPVAIARIQAHLRVTQPGDGAAGEPGPQDVRVGTVLGGRYRLEAKIGSGSFGAVYRARHEELGHAVAVKVLQVHAGASPEAAVRFRREGVTACRVKHPSAVSVLDFGVTPGGVAYLVMELLTGYPLEEELKGGPLPLLRSLRILAPVCEALAVAHWSGIVHRDIKPANIFLHQAGGREVPKVLDFGIARIAGEAVGQRVTVEGWIVGTPAYMAPERFTRQPVDGKADVYSVGVVLFQMLTGQLPFDVTGADPLTIAAQHAGAPPPSLRSVNADLPEAVDALLLRALSKEPAERPSALELGQRLRSLCA